MMINCAESQPYTYPLKLRGFLVGQSNSSASKSVCQSQISPNMEATLVVDLIYIDIMKINALYK